MTRLFVALCVFLLILLGDCCWCSTCGGASESPSSRLRRKLMCGYDKSQRPVVNKQDAVQLTILLWLSYIQIVNLLLIFLAGSSNTFFLPRLYSTSRALAYWVGCGTVIIRGTFLICSHTWTSTRIASISLLGLYSKLIQSDNLQDASNILQELRVVTEHIDMIFCPPFLASKNCLQFADNWEDEFLTWDPLQYNNETGFSIHPSTIWTPTLASARENSLMGSAPVLYKSQMLCMLKSSGLVHCAWPTMYRSPCKSDDRLWPFNTKKCQVFIDQWDDGQDKVNMTLHKYKLVAALWSKGTWELIKYNASMTAVTSELSVIHRVVYSFFLRRRWTIMTTLVFTSTLCAMCLTLTPFFIHHLRRGRLFVAVGAIVLHVCSLQTLGYLIDHTLVGLPLIVIFFRDSLIMAAISLVLTVFWTIPVSGIARYFPVVMANKTLDKYLTLFRLKVEGGEQEMDEGDSFESLIRVVDVICLIIFVMSYVVLCAKFIP